MGKGLKNIILAGAFSALLANANPAVAEEKKPAFDIDIIVNYGTGSKEEKTDYSSFYATYGYGEDDSRHLYTDFPGLESYEKKEVENIFSGIKNDSIKSYDGLLETATPLSEAQKIVLLTGFSKLAYSGGYDFDYFGEEVDQSTFFDRIQEYLGTDEKVSIGKCRHIGVNVEEMANDIGIRAAAITGIIPQGPHVYDLLKTGNGITFINWGNILTTNTKNVEKALQAFQKNQGMTSFFHNFYEDAELKYGFITKDGKNLLDFIGYDESLDSSKKYLTSDKIPDWKKWTIKLDHTDYLNSAEGNFFGPFWKMGKITGSVNSPLKEMILVQTGYKNNFSFENLFDFSPNINYIVGNLSQDAGEFPVLGFMIDLIAKTNNEKGLNLSSMVSGVYVGSETMAFDKDYNLVKKNFDLFSDLSFDAGISYKFITDFMRIEPYTVSKFSFLPKNVARLGGLSEFFEGHKLEFKELRAGSVFDFNLPDFNFSIDPYYSLKNWEHEFGGNIKIGNKNIALDAGGYLTLSTYDFCPNKSGFNVGLELSLGNINFNVSIKNDRTNYDGEIEDNFALSLEGKLNLDVYSSTP
ncbi:MAG: hypothetical protein M1416_00235 [Candidatus Pacearchaeota archaeon]|nr:hypothetical protein [Candidatus Pacearchaeota archaeon]